MVTICSSHFILVVFVIFFAKRGSNMLNPERDPERDVDLQTLIFWVDCEF